MGVVVFDADVLIAYLKRDDANHTAATERVRAAMAPGNQRTVCAVNYSEVLIGPLRALGTKGGDMVDDMLTRLNIVTIQVDMDLARRAAAVRERTHLKLPDAYAVATAIHHEHRGHSDVRLETFDQQVTRRYAELHPRSE